MAHAEVKTYKEVVIVMTREDLKALAKFVCGYGHIARGELPRWARDVGQKLWRDASAVINEAVEHEGEALHDL